MINLDNGLGAGFLAECGEQLITLEKELLALETGGADIDQGRADRAFRLAHSIRGGAYFLDLAKIGDLAHETEDMLALICSRQMVPTMERVDVLLRATDIMNELIQSPATSHQADIGAIMDALAGMTNTSTKTVVSSGNTHQRPLRLLVVEDDFTSRLLLQTFLARYGECHIAVNGREAVEACSIALDRGEHYDLICMDIMMPELDGREAVRRVRALEEAKGITSIRGAKITMTTTVGDMKKVFQCFKELCDAYLVKPIDLARLLGHMESWGMVRSRKPV